MQMKPPKINRAKRYITDLNEGEWKEIKYIISEYSQKKISRKHELREIVNAIRYQRYTNCVWEMLPHDFPPSSTVYGYYRLWNKDGTWARMNKYFGKQRPLELTKPTQLSFIKF